MQMYSLCSLTPLCNTYVSGDTIVVLLCTRQIGDMYTEIVNSYTAA
jgi:hypothetical protein